MKHCEIVIGNVYAIKVSGRIACVKVTHDTTTTAYGTYASASRYGSCYGKPKRMKKFYGLNLRTKRVIGPFTAAKCRFEVTRSDKFPDGKERWVRA
jgi:hypothetical protein